jgi:HK97 family phage major capsid protein
MTTKEMREEAHAIVKNAESVLESGDVEQFNNMISDAKEKMEKADQIDAAHRELKAVEKDFSSPVNDIPVVSSDVAKYDPNDTTAKIKGDYKPAGWVKGLPSVAQPTWVLEQCGENIKADARFIRDTWVKWMTSSSQEIFFKTATPDEIKAMQEDTDAEGGYFVPEEFINQVIHDPGVPGSQLRPNCTVIRVASKDGYVPTLASASWAAIAEEASFSDQTPTVGQVAFSIEKSGGLVKVTRELLDDSAVNLPSLLSQLFTEAAGRFEDAGILNGNNTAQYDGILGSGVADYVMAATGALTTADLLGIFYTLNSQFRQNATWVMPSLITKFVNSIQSTAAGVTGIDSLTASPDTALLGKPVVNTDDTSNNGFSTALAANNEIGILGDFRNYYIFDRVGMTIRRNDSLKLQNWLIFVSVCRVRTLVTA